MYSTADHHAAQVVYSTADHHAAQVVYSTADHHAAQVVYSTADHHAAQVVGSQSFTTCCLSSCKAQRLVSLSSGCMRDWMPIHLLPTTKMGVLLAHCNTQE